MGVLYTEHNDQKRDISETRAQIAQLRVRHWLSVVHTTPNTVAIASRVCPCAQVEEQSLPAHVEVLKAEETKQLENIAAATAGGWWGFCWCFESCDQSDVALPLPAANEKQKEHTFELNQLTRGIVFYKRLGLELESVQASGVCRVVPRHQV